MGFRSMYHTESSYPYTYGSRGASYPELSSQPPRTDHFFRLQHHGSLILRRDDFEHPALTRRTSLSRMVLVHRYFHVHLFGYFYSRYVSFNLIWGRISPPSFVGCVGADLPFVIFFSTPSSGNSLRDRSLSRVDLLLRYPLVILDRMIHARLDSSSRPLI